MNAFHAWGDVGLFEKLWNTSSSARKGKRSPITALNADVRNGTRAQHLSGSALNAAARPAILSTLTGVNVIR